MKRLFIFALSGILLLSCESSDVIKDPPLEETFSFGDYEWQSFNSSVFESNLDEETLTLTLQENSAWFNAETGGMYHTSISGDFDFSATVTTSILAGTKAPSQSYSFGGLVARDPSSTLEDYVHVVTGTGVNTQSPVSGYEYKITRDSESEYVITQNGSHAHDLRMLREGSLFSFYQRTAGSQEDWTLIHSTEQNLPSDLQIGFTIYTAYDGPEIVDMQVVISNVNLQ